MRRSHPVCFYTKLLIRVTLTHVESSEVCIQTLSLDFALQWLRTRWSQALCPTFLGQHVAVTFTRRNASRATIMSKPSKDSAADQVKVQLDEANRCFALKKYDGAADLLASALEEL